MFNQTTYCIVLLRTHLHNYRIWAAIIAAVVVIALVIYGLKRQKKGGGGINILQLRSNYEEALKSGNRLMALQKGREYYRSLRGGAPLTIFDEQEIARDIATTMG